MDKQIVISIDDSLLKNATQLLDQIGLDIQSAVKVFITRLVREQSISFLLDSIQPIQKAALPIDQTVTRNSVLYQSEKGDMTKSRALSLFRYEGVIFNRNVTFASKNRTAYNYWANPEFQMLKNDWYLILNDWSKKELYLFLIPANTINASELTARSDKSYLIDLQIAYSDDNFCDNRSGYCFLKHLIKQIKY